MLKSSAIVAASERIVPQSSPPYAWNCRCARCARWPSRTFIVSSVVETLPGTPRLLQCRWIGCGIPRSSMICARPEMIFAGVTVL